MQTGESKHLLLPARRYARIFLYSESVKEETETLEEKITYFETPGLDNTEETLRLTTERAQARGINRIVLASTRGDTARRYAELLEGTGMTMVVVPHQYGFGERQRFPKELVDELTEKGHTVYFGTMLFHTDGFLADKIPSVMAGVLRTFCQGMKVVEEIVMMAANGGCVEQGEQVIAVAGTGRGADTSVVMAAATSTKYHELKVLEIICKPLETKSWPAGERPNFARPPEPQK